MRAKNSQKPIKCVETGVVYENAKLAAEFVGKSVDTIYSCALGRQKTCGGYNREYVKKITVKD